MNIKRAARAAMTLALLTTVAWVGACSRTPATPPGLTESGTLRACPDSPNCVSSLATDEKHMTEALPLLGSPDTAVERLAQLVNAMPRTTILKQEDNYLAAQFTTRLMRYKDDVEFLVDRDKGVIHIRSASRVGYSDMGANRKRVEQIRAAWADMNPAE